MSETTLEQIAKKAEQKLYDEDQCFQLSEAMVYGIDPDGSAIVLAKHKDIYSLLQGQLIKFTVGSLCRDYVAMITTGMATPMDKNNKPKEGAKRKRVRIFLLSKKGDPKVASVCRFQDEPTEQVIDDNSGGPLQEAFLEMISNNTTPTNKGDK